MTTAAAARRHLKGMSEIRTFFRTNQTPVFSVGPTAFNLLGIDRFVRNFSYIAYYDSWDGRHPRVFSPRNKPYVDFQSTEEINNYLLRDPEVTEFLARVGGERPKIAMVFFDEESEQICAEPEGTGKEEIVMEWIEITGKTVEAAKAAALEELGIHSKN